MGEGSVKDLNNDLKVLIAESFTLEDGTENGIQIKPFYNEKGLHIPMQTVDGAIWYMLISTDIIDKMILDFIDRQNNKE